MALVLWIDNYDRLENGGPTWITVNQTTVCVGRRAAMDWVLPDPSKTISGHHFDVAWRDNAYWLTDLSTNGTWLEGQRHRLSEPLRLKGGERFLVGPYMIGVKFHETQAEPPQEQRPEPAPPPPEPASAPDRITPHHAAGFAPEHGPDDAGSYGSERGKGADHPTGHPYADPAPSPAPDPVATPIQTPGLQVPTPVAPGAGRASELQTPSIQSSDWTWGPSDLDPFDTPSETPSPHPEPQRPETQDPVPDPRQAPPTQAPHVPDAPADLPGRAPAPMPFDPASTPHPQAPTYPHPSEQSPAQRGPGAPVDAPFPETTPQPVHPRPSPPNAPLEPLAPPSLAPSVAPPLDTPAPRMPDAYSGDVQAASTFETHGLSGAEHPASTVIPPDAPRPVAMPKPGPMDTPAPPPAPSPEAKRQDPSLDAAIRAFFEGAELDPALANDVDAVQLMYALGRSVRLSADEIMRMLRSRRDMKVFTRSGQSTMLGATDNNPLKLLPEAREALEAMYVSPRHGFMKGEEALEDALIDVRLHQEAIFRALQPALREVLSGLSPEEIEALTEGSGSLLPGGRKGRNWATYVERWDAKAQVGENGMLDAFLQAFAKTYAVAAAKNKTLD